MIKRSYFLYFIAILAMFSSCSVSNHSMKSPNYHIEFYKSDFEYSAQVSAQATSVRVLGIDWERLFSWQAGEINSDLGVDNSNNPTMSSSLLLSPSFESFSVATAVSSVIPVLGDYGKGKICNYALYNLMNENPGYDVVVYPQYETKRFIIPLFYSKRTTTVTARLGKIK